MVMIYAKNLANVIVLIFLFYIIIFLPKLHAE